MGEASKTVEGAGMSPMREIPIKESEEGGQSLGLGGRWRSGGSWMLTTGRRQVGDGGRRS